jgi:hypothetical protein
MGGGPTAEERAADVGNMRGGPLAAVREDLNARVSAAMARLVKRDPGQLAALARAPPWRMQYRPGPVPAPFSSLHR